MDRHPRRPSAAIAVFLIVGTLARGADPVEKAKALLKDGDPGSAAKLLEAALPTTTPGGRGPLVAELRLAYEAAIRKADEAGRKDEAGRYRDNLEILGRKSRAPKPPAAPEPIAVKADEPPKPAPPIVEMADTPFPDPPRKIEAPEPAAEPPASPDPFVAQPAKALEAADSPSRDDSVERARQIKTVVDTPREVAEEPKAEPVAEPPAPRDDLSTADDAFRDRRFDEAGAIYAKLAQAHALPEARRDAWAYCRCHEVVRRINADPKTAEEWAAIRGEIEQIRRLSPKLWYAEYLRNLVAERSGSKAKAAPRRPVLRGASPDEPPPSKSSKNARVGKPGASANGWKVWESNNFRILHLDDALAEKAAVAAEAAREAHIRRWAGNEATGAWTPRCDIFLYPTSAQFQKATGQGEESPGFSTMGMGGGRVVDRRITLRADNPKLLSAVLPHEVTHVVLADLFPTSQIPRWADEGISVLSEPPAEQRLRDADLAEPLASGRVFGLQDLMVMDYPEGENWGLYYAQSVSLTRFLVDRGSPSKFIKFVRDARGNGLEAELKRAYHIDGFADLQRQWQEHARSRMTNLASTEGESKGR